MSTPSAPRRTVSDLGFLPPLAGFPALPVMVMLLLAYVAWISMTPYTRFPVFTDIRFERLLFLAMGMAWLLSGEKRPVNQHRIGIALIGLFGVMWASYQLSDYTGSFLAKAWVAEYWKELVLFFFLAYGIHTRNHLAALIIGAAAIALVYQAYSWLDFLRGGSYVYQQGLKRMIAVWSFGGVGAANGWGSFALYALPMAVFWHRVAWNKLQQFAAVSLMAISAASIVFSGTRAAVVCAVVYGAYLLRSHILKPARVLAIVVLAIVAWTQLPQTYRDRMMLIQAPTQSAALSGSEAVAVRSGEARLQGLIDGWGLFKQSPVIGFGPGSSRDARWRFHPEVALEDLEQLHNLYGQILGEIGALGAAAFVFYVLSIRTATRTPSLPENAAPLMGEALLGAHIASYLRTMLWLMLLYGLFSHSLYHDNWILLGGMATVYASTATAVVGRRQDTGGEARS